MDTERTVARALGRNTELGWKAREVTIGSNMLHFIIIVIAEFWKWREATGEVSWRGGREEKKRGEEERLLLYYVAEETVRIITIPTLFVTVHTHTLKQSQTE